MYIILQSLSTQKRLFKTISLILCLWLYLIIKKNGQALDKVQVEEVSPSDYLTLAKCNA